MALRKVGKNTWRVDVAYVRPDGVHSHRVVTIQGTVEDAMAAGKSLKDGAGECSLKAVFPAVSNIIRQYRESHGDGGNTVHLNIVEEFFKESQADDRLAGVVDKFRAYQKTNGKSPATVNRRLACLRAALNWAVKRRILRYNPVGIWEFGKEHPRTRVLSVAEETALLEAIKGGSKSWYLYIPVKFLLRNPVRAADFVRLLTSNVDLENGWVEFEAGKTGNKTYCVVWDEEIRDFFIQAKKRIGPLFVGRNGRAIKSYRNAFESACKRAGIEGFRWHDLRRCAASWMLENGFQLTDLKKLGLWKSAQTIEKHYHQVQIKQIQRRFQVATVATNLLAVNG